MKNIIDKAAKIISAVMVLFALIIDIAPTNYINFYSKAVLYCIPAAVLFCNMIYQIKKADSSEEKETHRKFGLSAVFAIYAVTLFSLLFMRYGIFQSIVNFSPLKSFNKLHFELSANLVPFKSIKLFFDHVDKVNMFVVNIIGNIVVFMPMGFFAHFLFDKRIKNVGILVLFMIALVSVIEFLQFVFCVGSADIDDVILNTIGAAAVYLIFEIKPVKNAVNKLLE